MSVRGAACPMSCHFSRDLVEMPVGVLPDAATREGRVRLLLEAGQALLRGELPGPTARMFLGGALVAGVLAALLAGGGAAPWPPAPAPTAPWCAKEQTAPKSASAMKY